MRLIRTEDPEALAVIRHDCAHVMAEAVQDLFPGTQVTIGPAIENGFYYDFFRNEPFSTDDLAQIEARMAEIVKADKPLRARGGEPRRGARAVRATWASGSSSSCSTPSPTGEPVTLYHQDGWFDLCRGPHGPSTGRIGAFKLTKVAGAYWRGDAATRSCSASTAPRSRPSRSSTPTCTSWRRRSGATIAGSAARWTCSTSRRRRAGSVFWHPHGWTLWRAVESYIRRRLERSRLPRGQDAAADRPRAVGALRPLGEVRRAHVLARGREAHLALKPMNCPGHVQIFNQSLHSYRDLPLRMAEFGSCHRNEPSGALHGIMRVRAFTQDDAHIFCTPEQITAESVAFCELLMSVYHDFGFTDVRVKFSDRPPVRAGADEVWDQAEAALWEAVRRRRPRAAR